MSKNNNGNAKGKKSNAAQARKQLKNEILNEIRVAAGKPAQGKGRGKRNRQAKHQQQGVAAAYATGQAGQGAKVQASLDSCHVVHREFIGNVTGSVAFAIASTFAVNPGLTASFPWLAGIAQNWESYRFRKLRLCYYTRTGSNVPGSVILAHDPDSSDAAPSSEQVMTTYESCQEDAPWKDICMEIKQTSLREIGPRKFVRTTALSANQDIKLYDSGNLFVGTVDGTAVAWGKLWVEYDIDFFTPQLQPAGLEAEGGVLFNATASGALTTNLMGAATSSGSLVVTNALNVVTMSGLTIGSEYLATLMIGAATATTAVTFTFGAGATVKTAINSVSGANGASFGAAAGFIVNQTFTATALSATLTLGGATVLTTPTVCLLVVNPIPTITV